MTLQTRTNIITTADPFKEDQLGYLFMSITIIRYTLSLLYVK